MPKTAVSRERRFPLHVHISALFTLLLLLTGVVLGIFNYRQTTQVILSSSEKLFERIVAELPADWLKLMAQRVRVMRVYEGPSEVHRMSLAKKILKEAR